MADGYDDLFELGFEGLDKLTNKYHDKVFSIGDKRHSWAEAANKEKGQRVPTNGRRDSVQQQPRYIDPQRRRASSPAPTRMYTQDRRREADREVYGSVREEEARYYATPANNSVVSRSRDPYEYNGGYQLAARAPSPPQSEHGSRRYDDYYDDRRDVDRRRPLPPHRRGSSYSPPRRRERSPPRRQRSRSPNHHRVAATVVGAIAGGLIGNTVTKGGTIPTIAGAVVGGLGGRTAEKVYDHHKDREYRQEERWERRQQQDRERREYY